MSLEKLISAINDDLTSLIQDESQFTDANPYLFGSDFAKQAKEYLDQAGSLKSTTPEVEHNRRHLFREGLPRRGDWPEKGMEDPISENKYTNKEHGTSEGGQSTSRTKLCTHNTQFKNSCTFSEQKCNSVSGSCNGDSTLKYTYKSSGSAGTFPIKLGKSNEGPVGPKYGERVRNRVFIDTLSNPKALPSPTKSDPTGVGFPRDQRNDL
uniref:Uncharacterized protein n=1 Tax=Amphimedon queenslandica TaxID=400682 RepID=A0A1X7VSR2_AMPQE